jgi:hypothetical protein
LYDEVDAAMLSRLPQTCNWLLLTRTGDKLLRATSGAAADSAPTRIAINTKTRRVQSCHSGNSINELNFTFVKFYFSSLRLNDA